MPRANRHFLSGQFWHITHRCHERSFLFKFGQDRYAYRHWLFEVKKRFGLCVLNYVVTSNHIHARGWQRLARMVELRSRDAKSQRYTRWRGYRHSQYQGYPFQKYGMLDGVVRHVTYDAADKPADVNAERKSEPANALNYRALVALNASQLEAQGLRYKLIPGMQVAAEIHLGSRSVMEYLLSPVQKTVYEAGRER